MTSAFAPSSTTSASHSFACSRCGVEILLTLDLDQSNAALKVEMTLGIYAHVSPSMKDTAAKLAALLHGDLRGYLDVIQRITSSTMKLEPLVISL
jgi:hypothetical protein